MFFLNAKLDIILEWSTELLTSWYSGSWLHTSKFVGEFACRGKNKEENKKELLSHVSRLEIEDLHCMDTVKAKKSESKLFQARAEEARNDANNLLHILSRKRKKIEDDDFYLKNARLKLDEIEEKRKSQLKELQILETSRHDYHKMKLRIESGMKILKANLELQRQRQIAPVNYTQYVYICIIIIIIISLKGCVNIAATLRHISCL